MFALLNSPVQTAQAACHVDFRQLLLLRLRRVLTLSDCGQARIELTRLRQMLEGLPLDRHDFALACRRLASVRRYLQSDEWGAARYDLRLLIGQLRTPSRSQAGFELD